VSDRPLSPCVQICVIHEETGICAGCYRTREEIAVWGQLSNAARWAIMDSLPAREGLLKKRRGGRAARLQRGQS